MIGAELSNTQHGSWNEREALEAPVAEFCCLGKVDLSGYRDSLKIGFTCWVTRIKVVLRLNSFSLAAPTYVHVDRMPPRMSRIVCSTSPLKGTSTVFPSEALGKEILYYLFVQNFLSPVTLSVSNIYNPLPFFSQEWYPKFPRRHDTIFHSHVHQHSR